MLQAMGGEGWEVNEAVTIFCLGRFYLAYEHCREPAGAPMWRALQGAVDRDDFTGEHVDTSFLRKWKLAIAVGAEVRYDLVDDSPFVDAVGSKSMPLEDHPRCIKRIHLETKAHGINIPWGPKAMAELV